MAASPPSGARRPKAAGESGYSEERLREMARDGTLPHKKAAGSRGHLTIARCDPSQRPKPTTGKRSSLESRLLGPDRGHLRPQG